MGKERRAKVLGGMLHAGDKNMSCSCAESLFVPGKGLPCALQVRVSSRNLSCLGRSEK